MGRPRAKHEQGKGQDGMHRYGSGMAGLVQLAHVHKAGLIGGRVPDDAAVTRESKRQLRRARDAT